MPCKDGNGAVNELNRALRFESDKVTVGLCAKLKNTQCAKAGCVERAI